MIKIKKTYLLSIAIVSGLYLTSCGVTTKQYKTPQTDLTHLYRDNNAKDTTTIGDIPWAAYFKDSDLVALIEEGIKNNFDLKIAYTRIRQAEANLKMARGAFFPSVALSGEVQHTAGSSSGNVLGHHSTSYFLGVGASWEMEIWGKLSSQSKAQRAAYLNSHVYKNLIQTSLIANIASSYYSLLAMDEQLRITHETVGLLEDNLSTMKVLMAAGLQNGAAVEQSKATLYATQATIPSIEIRIRELENSLSVLLGRNPGTIARSTIDHQQVPEYLAYGIPAQVLSRRPDVQEAELSLRTAFELTNVARASFYPSIKLTSGSIGFNSTNSLSDFFKPANLAANIIGGLTQPIFAQRQLQANLAISLAQEQEALISFERTVLAAGQEVSDILYAFESSQRKNSIRKNQVEAALTAVDYTKELLNAGEANYIEVLSAEQSLLSAQLDQINDKLEQLFCTVDLYRALGGGVN